MRLITTKLFFIAFCSLSYSENNTNNDKLDQLIATWAATDADNPMAFSHLPRTTQEAIKQNCTELDNGCLNPLAYFKGVRYICNNSVDLILIYDVKGNVAGIQAAFAKQIADNQPLLGYDRSSYIHTETILGQEYYVVTVYFVDPGRICTGRSDSEFLEEGTVTDVYLQNGSDPIRDSKNTPILGDDSHLNSMGWQKQICIPRMGMHYAFAEARSCSALTPLLLMYDETSSRKSLTAIAFMMYGNYFSPRFEVTHRIPLAPGCWNEAYDQSDALTTFHVYFGKDPKSIRCNQYHPEN